MGEITPKQKEILTRIVSRIGGLRHLISDVLKLGELEMGEDKEVRRERFDLIRLISESIEEFRGIASEKGIKILFEKEVGSSFVLADPHRVDEVVHNYISNAIKYNRENGEVIIRASVEKDNIKISVTDTGRGIKEEELPRLFTDFFRSSDVKKEKIEGTGLGLAIVKRIIERYGGKVGVESIYQQGSTFWFTLPVDRSEESRTGAAT